MAGPSKSIQLDDDVNCQLWKEDEFSDDSDYDNDMVVKFLCGSKTQ